MVLLLFQVHATVSFRQQFFGVRAVFRINGTPYAQGKDVFIANFTSRGPGQLAQADPSSLGRGDTQAGRDNPTLVATHASHVVVFAAGALQALGKQAQETIAFQVAEAIVDLLKTIQVTNHYSDGGVQSLAARQLPVKVKKQRPGIGQFRQVIGGGGALRLLEGQRILHGESYLGADGQQDAEMVGRISIAIGMIKGEHSNNSGKPFQRNGDGGAQSAEPGGIVQVSRLNRRVPIHNGFAVLSHPAGNTLSQGN